MTRVVVRVPATSANLGPGFDAFGLALGLYDEVEVRRTGGGLVVTVEGEGASSLPRDERHLVVQAFAAASGRPPAGLSFTCRNRIPQGRGLGSSAAAIVAGVLAGRALGGLRTDVSAALRTADAIEGHPDNVAACLLGGFTIAWRDARGAAAVRVAVPPDLEVVLTVPPATASTAAVRRLLPATVPHGDAAANSGRAALFVAAMTGHPELLLQATEEWLHERYRAPAMPATAGLVALLRAAGIAAVVSGAGPSVLAFGAQTAAVAAEAPPGWQVMPLAMDLAGATVDISGTP